MLKEQRIRLALVDAFSPGSKKGRAATEYVTERLAFADRTVLHTQRADLHGRYVAHVFYSTRGLDQLGTLRAGRYLNQELVDRKLAVKVR